MLLGYTMDVSQNKYYMFNRKELEEADKYSNTYEVMKRLRPSNRIKTTKHMSCTYDGYTIVSEEFKEFCEQEKYEGIEFLILPSSPNYWFKINNVIEFDYEARKTRFINYNEQYGGYQEVIGATPACLKDKKPLLDGFYRTDLFFGNNANKNPLEIVGIETKKKLQLAGFKIIYFEDILDKYEWQK